MNLFRIVRNQNIYITDDNINSDGLYFFRLHGKTIALKDYHAKLWFRVPEGKELYPNEPVVEGNIVLHLTKYLRLESQVFLVNFIK